MRENGRWDLDRGHMPGYLAGSRRDPGGTMSQRAEVRPVTFGAHQSIGGGICNAITRGQEATCDAIQIFNKSSNQWRARPLGDEEVESFLELVEETGIAVVCSHVSYLINLASPDPALSRKSLASLKEEVKRCGRLQIPNLVLHPGAHVGSGEEKGIERIAENLNRLFDSVPDSSVTVCLETTAGAGSTLGRTFEELAAIIDRVDREERMGVCIDTCHVFAAGYPLAPPRHYRRTVGQFEEAVGLDRLQVMHLNDSKQDLGSHKDRHEHIGKGEIGLGGFRSVVNDPRLRHVPMILETPKGEDLAEDRENLKLLRSLVRKGKRAGARRG